MAGIGPSFAGFQPGGQLSPQVWQQLSSLYNSPAGLQALQEAGGGGLEYLDPETGYAFAPKFKEVGNSRLFDGGTLYDRRPGMEAGDNVALNGTPGYVFDAGGNATGQPFQFSGLKANTGLNNSLIGAGAILAAPFAAAALGAGAGAGAAGAAGSAGGAAGAAGALDLGGGLTMAADGSILGGLGAFTPATAAEMGAMGVGAAGAGGLAGGIGSVAKALGGAGEGGFSWGSLVGPALAAVGGIAGASAARDAAGDQLTAAREAQAKLEPWYQAGGNALNRLQELLGIGGNSGAADYGSAAKDFGAADFQTDPGYQFRQSEGEKALQRAASANGSFGSGKYLKDAMSFNQGQASQEYNNAFSRFYTARQNKLNPLQSLAGQGQTTAGTIADLSTQAGNAQAAGKVGSANALTNAIGQGFSMYQNSQQQDQNNSLMNLLLRRGV